MIKVKVNGTDEKVVLEGTVGMTVEVVDPTVYYEDEDIIEMVNTNKV